MDVLAFAVDFVLHVDSHLAEFVALHGAWVYALLFFLPGGYQTFNAGIIPLPCKITWQTVTLSAWNNAATPGASCSRRFGSRQRS